MSAQGESSNGGQEDDSWVIDSIANFTPLPSSTAKIHRVPTIMVKDTEEHYQKYYVPKVVSIGPYHHGNQKLELVEKLKPCFTMKLLSNNKENLRSLCTKFGQPNKVQELRNFYEEKSTLAFCNKVFVKMMLLDACFILYYIQHIFGEKFENCQELKSHQIVFVRQDLFLLENQIPFEVLDEVMKLMNIDRVRKIKAFIIDNILACGGQRKSLRESVYRRYVKSSSVISELDFNRAQPDHLLHLLHLNLTKEDKVPKDISSQANNKCTFRNVNELRDVGIHFKPSTTMSLADITFFKTYWWWRFSASVKLPPITVDDSTKPMFLNLISYEMCSHDARNSWVTSYVCFLDSLIDHPEDVKTLRKAGVLENSLGSDNEVAKLFNEIGTDLVPNNLAYSDIKNKIQRHYKSRRNGLFSQLKHEYIKSPWAFFALVGALMALFLSGVQTYYTVWSPKGECDDLCGFLKTNHHL